VYGGKAAIIRTVVRNIGLALPGFAHCAEYIKNAAIASTTQDNQKGWRDARPY
jgi:hypothetical protein